MASGRVRASNRDILLRKYSNRQFCDCRLRPHTMRALISAKHHLPVSASNTPSAPMLGPGPRDHSSEPDRGAPFAFHLGADIAHDAIHGDGIAPFVEPLDHDIALVGFHRDRSIFITSVRSQEPTLTARCKAVHIPTKIVTETSAHKEKPRSLPRHRGGLVASGKRQVSE
jgi:hypothetical protein